MSKNLKIRAYLQTPVISDIYLPLDGLILSLAMRKKYGEQIVTFSNQISRDLDADIPFEKHFFEDGNWCYKCSFAQWSGEEEPEEEKSFYSKRFNTKRSDMIDFGKKKAQVDISRGANKNLFTTIYQRHSLYVEWYCVGNKEELESLLGHALFLGKKKSQGCGAVLKWEIEELETDYSIYKEGKLMRTIPNQKGIVYGLRPPYWFNQNQFLVEMP